MACPFFMPTEKLEGGAWPHPGRLPLGGGWSGQCTAPGHEGEVPERDTLEQSCNLGYAGSCPRLPPERAWDAVRFALTAQRAGDESRNGDGEVPNGERGRLVQIQYVCEREHRPVEQGKLIFDAAGVGWLQRHSDDRVQKMAECFLESHQARLRTAIAS